MSLPLTNTNNDMGVITFEIPTPFPVGGVNLYLIFGDKITLVDTGPKTELAWKSLIYLLNKNKLRIKDIDEVILTHHHVDHSGLVSILKEHHPQLKISAHQATVPWVEKRKETIDYMLDFYEQLYQKNGLSESKIDDIRSFYNYFDQYVGETTIDNIVNEGDKLNGHSGWEIIHNPGHAQGHVSLFNKKNKILIAGDHLISHTASGTFVEPPLDSGSDRPRSLVDYQRSLIRLTNMDIHHVYSGHGKVIDNPMEVIEQQLLRYQHKTEKLLQFLKEDALSVYELMKGLYPNYYKKNMPMFFSEVLGTLDLLEEEGKLNKLEENGVIKYFYSDKMVQ